VNVETTLRADVALFSESQSRVLLSARPEKADALVALLKEKGVVCSVLGKVEGSDLVVRVNGRDGIAAPVEELWKVWKEAIPCLLKS